MRRLISGAGLHAQLVRFLLGGGGVAALTVVVYWLAAGPLGRTPMQANLLSYAFNVAIGFGVHGRWSFAVDRTRRSRPAALRYLVISLGALGLNSLWVWLLTGVSHAAAWTPVVPMLLATPIFTFWAGRQWVFEAARPPRG